MGDPDGEAYVEDVEDGYIRSPPLESLTPFQSFMIRVSGVLTSPWFVLSLCLFLYYVYVNYLRERIQKWRKRRAEALEMGALKKNPDLIKNRMEAVERARRKLQEEHDAAANAHAEKVAKNEELKRKKKIEDWETLQKGGSISKTKKSTNEYNPLMGGGGNSCYRPTRRGGSGGGG